MHTHTHTCAHPYKHAHTNLLGWSGVQVHRTSHVWLAHLSHQGLRVQRKVCQGEVLLRSGMCHTVIWDVQYGKICVKYNTAYYTNKPYDTSLVAVYVFYVQRPLSFPFWWRSLTVPGTKVAPF